jgi:hypothetical protein
MPVRETVRKGCAAKVAGALQEAAEDAGLTADAAAGAAIATVEVAAVVVGINQTSW